MHTSTAILRSLIRFAAAMLLFAAAAPIAPRIAHAQETPYFVAYSHHLEEPDNLEVEFNSNFGIQQHGNDFVAPWMEFEYGVKAWWTTEVYLDTQSTFHDSTQYTGFRWENRFRPLMREHWINPVLYVEYENTNGADKTIKEVVGFDGAADHAVPSGIASRDHAHELEGKLILSSDYRGWNISENFVGEKNLGHQPWEFGYAVGFSRPLGLAATPQRCNFCRENFLAGIEFYGGLGTSNRLTTSHTSHYAAPILSWQLPSGAHLTVSPGWGLTSPSQRFLLRWSLTFEIAGFTRKLRSLP